MIRLITSIIIAPMILISCNSSNQKKSSKFIDSLSTSDSINREKDSIFNELLEFSETWDKNFCNPDSIVPSDCSFGNIYLTKKGFAIYSFFCFGSDSTTYCIGDYKFNKSGICCSFKKSYTYFSKVDDFETPDKRKIDPNSGVLRDGNLWTINLIKIDCKDFSYHCTLCDGKIYVIKKLDKSNSGNFMENLNKINVLEKYYK